ncbi:hypothetical protein RGU76_12900 [Bacillus pseudomycoides]|uniref:hypothetical protein n=1 Tax=Bacillus TaxID=1386 RepID=UPI002248C5DD|nr:MULTISPECIES: hypothetical protein [Bacillus]MCX2824335.1 hypothetical protein [Bacillus sp. DHT2]MDR4915924.1 hypothetical protein [Bacillus pseudomycoides]MEB3052546.1 hypothetical protein [Bacillus pseudomycoides]
MTKIRSDVGKLELASEGVYDHKKKDVTKISTEERQLKLAGTGIYAYDEGGQKSNFINLCIETEYVVL